MSETNANEPTSKPPGESRWWSVLDPKVLAALFGAIATVLGAYIAQHSFADKTICRINAADMKSLAQDGVMHIDAFRRLIDAIEDRNRKQAEDWDQWSLDAYVELNVLYQKYKYTKLTDADFKDLAKKLKHFFKPPAEVNSEEANLLRSQQTYTSNFRRLLSTCP